MFAQLLEAALKCVSSHEDLVKAAKTIEAGVFGQPLDPENPSVVALTSNRLFVIESILDKLTPVLGRRKRGDRVAPDAAEEDS